MEIPDWSRWWQPLLAAAIVAVVALVLHRIGRLLLRRLFGHTVVPAAFLRHIDRPSQAVLPLLGTMAVWQAAPDTLHGLSAVHHVNGVLLIAAITWWAVEAVRGAADGIIARHPFDTGDNLQARRVLTQTRVLSRTVASLLVIAGLAFVLMTFPGARQLGASLLASAGIVGLVAGIAARSVFSNLIAGLQIALSQPIRIDDVLIVQGEWGRVEEITGTYVVLAIWDQRRLIIPLQWFIENPFQNWTRTSAQLLGTVFLWVDPTLPLEPLRHEARRLCEASPDWDGRLCKVQVTDTSERCMQLRVLVSSASSGQSWDLRCAVREGLIDFIRREHPGALPRLRAEWAAAPGATAPGPGSAGSPDPARP